MTNRRLAEIIKWIIESQDLTLSKVAAKAKISRTNLSAILNDGDEFEMEETVKSVVTKIKRVFPEYFVKSDKTDIKAPYAWINDGPQRHNTLMDDDGSKKGDQQLADKPKVFISYNASDQSDRDLLVEILINQKATLQYLREIEKRLDAVHASDKDTSLDAEVRKAVRKDKSAEKDKQSNRDS